MTEITISALGARGEGVAEFKGERLFVPFALPGELVELSSVAGGRGVLKSVLSPSPERIDAFCPHFTRCGGCQLQHLSRPLYESFKRGLVETPLRRVGIETEIGPLVDAQGDGRRRATLHARKNGGGFMQLKSHDVYNLDLCPILVPALQTAAPAITRAAFAAIGVCDVSVTAADNGLDVAIKAEATPRSKPWQKKDVPHEDRLFPLFSQFGLTRVALNGESLVMQAPPELRIGRAVVRLPAGSFLQATARAEAELARLVLAGIGPAQYVADLFCGIGPFALRLAETARIHAADSDKPAIAALAAAVRATTGLKAVTTASRDLFRDPLVPVELDVFDAVVFDPPRAGAEAQARQLALSKVPRVVAVSCDPGTFARDAAILVGGGYRLQSVTPLDQFAYSAHVEVVGIFSR